MQLTPEQRRSIIVTQRLAGDLKAIKLMLRMLGGKLWSPKVAGYWSFDVSTDKVRWTNTDDPWNNAAPSTNRGVDYVSSLLLRFAHYAEPVGNGKWKDS